MEADVRPKVEEVEDESLEDIKQSENSESPEQPATEAVHGTKAPRKRGRPRKHPLPSPAGLARVAKGRSKTGCITCRRRKKKCDETKPWCQNCQKNAVVCEGYPPKEIWRSGRQKAEEGTRLFEFLMELVADLSQFHDGLLFRPSRAVFPS